MVIVRGVRLVMVIVRDVRLVMVRMTFHSTGLWCVLLIDTPWWTTVAVCCKMNIVTFQY